MGKRERELRIALEELGCTNITFLGGRVHAKISVCLPNGVTRVITCSKSPKNNDTSVMETRRVVRRIIEGRYK
jgi:LmbE family N-acetylglucosaminyl deacetylase